MTEELKPVDDAVLRAAYAHVDSVVAKAAGTDRAGGILWHGWAVREAFIAGAKWERERCAQIADEVQGPDMGRAARVAAAIRKGESQ